MTAALVTVTDHIPFSASVSPEQAAAYCRHKLPGWQEVQHDRGPDREPWIIMFTAPDGPPLRQVMIPNDATFADYSRRMAELCSALVALGCAERPSEILRGMGEERL